MMCDPMYILHRTRTANSCVSVLHRHSTNVVDLDGRRVLTDQKFEPQIRRSGCRGELDVGVLEKACPRGIASIHGAYGLMVDHYAHEPLRLGTFVEVNPEIEVVCNSSDGGYVLTDGCRVHVRIWGNRSHLVEFIGKVGGVTRRGDLMRSTSDVLGDPGSKAAFEATVADSVVGRTCGCACWTGCLGGHSRTDGRSAGAS